VYQRHGASHDPPGDHDAHDPDARAEAMQRKIARDLEGDVAEKEDPGAEAEHRRREAEVLVHVERGEADIHPVEEVDRVGEAEERDQADNGFADRGGKGRVFALIARDFAGAARVLAHILAHSLTPARLSSLQYVSPRPAMIRPRP
jgi:hypothetical protein